MPYMDAIGFIGCSFGFEMMNDSNLTKGLETTHALVNLHVAGWKIHGAHDGMAARKTWNFSSAMLVYRRL